MVVQIRVHGTDLIRIDQAFLPQLQLHSPAGRRDYGPQQIHVHRKWRTVYPSKAVVPHVNGTHLLPCPEKGFSVQCLHRTQPPFIAGSGVHGAWDEGYIHPASGICIVNGDELLFYFGAWSGKSPRMGRHMYAGGSTGVATLRRDGFAALTTNSTGRMSTPPVCFHGEGLWVNAQCKSLRAEIQDKNGHALPGLSFQDCICRSVNSTKQQVLWNSAVLLHAISGKPVRIAFELEQGKLFSFWISNDKSGSSGGYLAAGSVQHSSIMDETYE